MCLYSSNITICTITYLTFIIGNLVICGIIFAGGHNEAITLMSLQEFLDTDMYKQVILQIILPPLDAESYVLKFYKVCI